jgi:hypothetical protein
MGAFLDHVGCEYGQTVVPNGMRVQWPYLPLEDCEETGGDDDECCSRTLLYGKSCR